MNFRGQKTVSNLLSANTFPLPANWMIHRQYKRTAYQFAVALPAMILEPYGMASLVMQITRAYMVVLAARTMRRRREKKLSAWFVDT